MKKMFFAERRIVYDVTTAGTAPAENEMPTAPPPAPAMSGPSAQPPAQQTTPSQATEQLPSAPNALPPELKPPDKPVTGTDLTAARETASKTADKFIASVGKNLNILASVPPPKINMPA